MLTVTPPSLHLAEIQFFQHLHASQYDEFTPNSCFNAALRLSDLQTELLVGSLWPTVDYYFN
jgi:hypothetical protein